MFTYSKCQTLKFKYHIDYRNPGFTFLSPPNMCIVLVRAFIICAGNIFTEKAFQRKECDK